MHILFWLVFSSIFRPLTKRMIVISRTISSVQDWTDYDPYIFCNLLYLTSSIQYPDRWCEFRYLVIENKLNCKRKIIFRRFYCYFLITLQYYGIYCEEKYVMGQELLWLPLLLLELPSIPYWWTLEELISYIPLLPLIHQIR